MASGYAYGEPEPIVPCPYCELPCRADFVDIGVGMQQCGPYHCEHCGASEIGPFDKERELTEDEQRTGWYRPGAEPGSSANVIGGRVVSHRQVERAYRETFTGNPNWSDKNYVEEWWKSLRSKK